MAKKIGVTKSEMLQMREQGLSNKDIAKCLDINLATVYAYIGKQGGRMESLAAFEELKPESRNYPRRSRNPPPKPWTALKWSMRSSRAQTALTEQRSIMTPRKFTSLIITFSLTSWQSWQHSLSAWQAE